MKKKILCCALLGAMSMAQSAMAQDFDDRWYISGTAGIFASDSDRLDARNEAMYGVGVGKMVTQNVSIDIEFDHSHPRYQITPSRKINVTTLGVAGRYHFIKEGRNWWPYLVGGIGASRNDSNGLAYEATNLFLKAGAGLQADVSERIDIRLEAGLRHEMNDDFGGNGLTDLYTSASVLFALGNLAAPVVPDAPQAEDCSTKDDDNDGVNNCNDRCPNSQAGETVGADGCKVEVAIDLKGVNFNFDKDTLRPDAIAILDNAAEVLNRYPTMKVSVDGHTDLCGSDTYNQDLSQRRAQVVYNYLTEKGVDAARLGGPTGYGESRPLEATSQDFPACKSETNRRTELKSN